PLLRYSAMKSSNGSVVIVVLQGTPTQTRSELVLPHPFVPAWRERSTRRGQMGHPEAEPALSGGAGAGDPLIGCYHSHPVRLWLTVERLGVTSSDRRGPTAAAMARLLAHLR